MRWTSKFTAKKTKVDGHVFPSQKEAARYMELKFLEKTGQITQLVLQPEFPISINGIKVCKYIADFQYFEDGGFVVEDTKGFQTPVFRLKKRLFEAFYNTKLRIT